jgi:DNA-binding transcriptional LysR family regulator
MGFICYESIQMTTAPHEPLETAELLAFTRVVEARSLSKAAQQLKIPRATLGRRLARLEERLGTRLVRRTTRSLAITDAGELLYHRARVALDAVTQAEAAVKRGDGSLRGELRVSLPPVSTREFVGVLLDFARAHAEVRCHFDFSTRHVDLTRDGYDAALRATDAELEPGLVSRVIARGRSMAVAAPRYLETHGMPRSAQDLAGHRCLMGFRRGEHAQTTWPRVGGGTLRVDGHFFANDLRVLAEAVVGGMGIALLPELITRDLVERRALVQVLPNVVGGENRASIVYAERELMPPQLRAFIDWVIARLPAVMTRPPATPSRRGKVHGGRARRE